MSNKLDDLINEKINKIKERKSKEYLESLDYIDKWLCDIEFTLTGITLHMRKVQGDRPYWHSTLYLPDEKSNLYTSFPNLKKLIGLFIDMYNGNDDLFDELKRLIISNLSIMQDKFETDVIEMDRNRMYY